MNTVLEVFEHRVNDSSTRPALRRRVDGVWASMSWKEWWEAAERVAAGLVASGIQPGDRVLLLSGTRVEWMVCDMGIMMAGAITVPVYPSLGARLVHEVALDSGAVAAIVSNPSQIEKLVLGRDELAVEHVFWMDPECVRPRIDAQGRIAVRLEDVLEEDDPWNRSLEDLGATGRRLLAEDSTVVSRRRRAVSADDIATIVYTSGTTGHPRGVVLSHSNLVHQIHAMDQIKLLRHDDLQFLFLPLAHIFARVMCLAAIGCGIETAVPDDIRSLLADMREVEPTFFAAVPQLFEQVRTKIERDGQRGPVQEQLFRVAEVIGTSTERARRNLEPKSLKDRLARAVLDKVQPDRARQLFGGRARFAVSGGAPLNPQTLEFFATFGLPVLEGYGLTETTAVATVNLPEETKPGSVGQPLHGVDITIDEDGEVLIRGGSVSVGYWRDEAGTRASRTEDGWLRTGDLGSFDRDGFLHITGRKKELIVTAGGKNIAPNPVESALEGIAGVDRAILFGDHRPFVVALLTLTEDASAQWGEEGDDELSERLDTAVAEINRRMAGYGTVRRWAIVDELGNHPDATTPTGKLRRERIAEIYADEIEALYS